MAYTHGHTVSIWTEAPCCRGIQLLCAYVQQPNNPLILYSLIRTVNLEPFGSSSSLIGQSKECQKLARDSLISLAKFIKPRSSLGRMDQSLCTAGMLIWDLKSECTCGQQNMWMDNLQSADQQMIILKVYWRFIL